MPRAQAAISTGIVRLGNAAIERRWSTYTGATTELLLNHASQDYLTRKSPEFHIDYGERPLAVTDLGDVSWSESCDSFGASVTLEQHGPDIGIRLKTQLAHEAPWMVRELQITNTGDTTVTITRVAADVLPVDVLRFSPAQRDVRTEFCSPETLRYAVLNHSGAGLLLGAPEDHSIALFDPNPKFCAPVWTGSQPVAPGKTWAAPPVGLFWVKDLTAPGLGADLERMHTEWQTYRQRYTEQRDFAR